MGCTTFSSYVTTPVDDVQLELLVDRFEASLDEQFVKKLGYVVHRRDRFGYRDYSAEIDMISEDKRAEAVELKQAFRSKYLLRVLVVAGMATDYTGST